MKNIKLKSFIILSTLGLISCKPKFEIPEENMGTINAQNYIALGGSNTSGYSDGAFNLKGQENCYAEILTTQFNRIEPVSFNQAFVSQIGINLDGQSKLEVGYKTDCNNETSLSVVRVSPIGDNSILSSNVSNQGTYNNLAFPSTSVLEVNQLNNLNPFYNRVVNDPSTESILDLATSNNPTFFTLQLGEDDILAYSTSGATIDTIPPTNGPAGVAFDGSLEEIITAMMTTGGKGALLNIPNVLNHPYFNTIPYNGLEIDASTAASLNNTFNPIGISFQEGPNGFLIEDQSEPFGVRKMVPGEKILLSIPLDSVKCFGMGITGYIPDKYSLTLDEVNEIIQKINEYNEVIANLATQNNLALVDLNELYGTFLNTTVYNGVSMSTEFITGGTFSLDGLNLNPIGQAKIANAIIEQLNVNFNSSIPFADVTSYSGIIFP